MDKEILLGEIERNLGSSAALRLFHGRGQCFPGWAAVTIDYYAPVLVCALFEPEAEAPLREALVAIEALLGDADRPIDAIVVQRRFGAEQRWLVARGHLPDTLVAVENGLEYEITLMKNQNIGFFPDMRLGRERVRALAKGRRVLNLFAYTCAFSVTAMAGGAASVINMDLNKSALRTGRANHIRNDQDPRKASFFSFDVLKAFGRMVRTGPHDLVVIDPPTHQKGAFSADRDYARIVGRLADFTAPGADVLACLNAPHLDRAFLQGLFADQPFTHLDWLGRPPECPERDPDRSLVIGHFRRES